MRFAMKEMRSHYHTKIVLLLFSGEKQVRINKMSEIIYVISCLSCTVYFVMKISNLPRWYAPTYCTRMEHVWAIKKGFPD